MANISLMEQNGVLRPPAADLPLEVRDLAQFLRTLMTSLGTSPAHYSALTPHDPEAMEHYLDGSSLPPRDVVAALLRELARRRGVELTPEAEQHARELHTRAVRAVDARPGQLAELRAELDTLGTAAERSARREQQLLGDVRAQQAAVQGGAVGHVEYRRQLIAIHEELRRVRARRSLAELRQQELAERLEAVRRRHQPPEDPTGEGPADVDGAPGGSGPGDPSARPAGPGTPPRDGRPGPGSRSWHRHDTRSGNRVADGYGKAAGGRGKGTEAIGQSGLDDRAGSPAPNGAGRGRRRPAPAELQPTGSAPAGDGAAGHNPARAALARDPQAKELTETVIRLRAGGRGREAQQLLWKAAAWPPERFPALLASLVEAGQRSDAAVLLWELSSRAPREVAAFSAWLAMASMTEECRDLLDHASTRPHDDVAATATGLAGAGWHDQARILLVNVARDRPPQVVAGLAGELAAAEAGQLLRELLAAVSEVPRDRQLLIAAAMRGAGLPQTADDVRG